MNVYSFIGRLSRDCETRFTAGGMAICSFSAAVDYGFGEKKGTNWIRCSLFGKRAEGQLPKYLVKGTQVAITGELRIREYDDKEGNRRTSVEVTVDKLDLVGGRSDQSQGGGYAQPAQQQQDGFPTHGGGQAAQQQQQQQPQQPQQRSDPFADRPAFNDVPVDDDIPF